MNLTTLVAAIEKVENDLMDADVPDTHPVIKGQDGVTLLTSGEVFAMADLLRHIPEDMILES